MNSKEDLSATFNIEFNPLTQNSLNDFLNGYFSGYYVFTGEKLIEIINFYIDKELGEVSELNAKYYGLIKLEYPEHHFPELKINQDFTSGENISAFKFYSKISIHFDILKLLKKTENKKINSSDLDEKFINIMIEHKRDFKKTSQILAYLFNTNDSFKQNICAFRILPYLEPSEIEFLNKNQPIFKNVYEKSPLSINTNNHYDIVIFSKAPNGFGDIFAAKKFIDFILSQHPNQKILWYVSYFNQETQFHSDNPQMNMILDENQFILSHTLKK